MRPGGLSTEYLVVDIHLRLKVSRLRPKYALPRVYNGGEDFFRQTEYL